MRKQRNTVPQGAAASFLRKPCGKRFYSLIYFVYFELQLLSLACRHRHVHAFIVILCPKHILSGKCTPSWDNTRICGCPYYHTEEVFFHWKEKYSQWSKWSLRCFLKSERTHKFVLPGTDYKNFLKLLSAVSEWYLLSKVCQRASRHCIFLCQASSCRGSGIEYASCHLVT